MAGTGPQPKISNGSSSAFSTAPQTMTRLGSRVSPAARRMLLAGMARKQGPAERSHTVMYERIRGRTSSDAFMARKRGVMKAKPIAPRAPMTRKARRRQSVATRLARAWLFWPRACETMAVAPVPRAMPMQPITITTGKVKPMAASALVPRRDTNQVSARLKAVMANVPATMGAAMPSMRRTMPPSVKSWCRLIAYAGAPSPRRPPTTPSRCQRAGRRGSGCTRRARPPRSACRSGL